MVGELLADAPEDKLGVGVSEEDGVIVAEDETVIEDVSEQVDVGD